MVLGFAFSTINSCGYNYIKAGTLKILPAALANPVFSYLRHLQKQTKRKGSGGYKIGRNSLAYRILWQAEHIKRMYKLPPAFCAD